MNAFRHHIPSFVDVEPGPDVEFDTVDELLALPLVAQWRQPFDDKPFHRFSLSGDLLMAEYDEGRAWWVVGYLAQPILPQAGLPQWEPVR